MVTFDKSQAPPPGPVGPPPPPLVPAMAALLGSEATILMLIANYLDTKGINVAAAQIRSTRPEAFAPDRNSGSTFGVPDFAVSATISSSSQADRDDLPPLDELLSGYRDLCARITAADNFIEKLRFTLKAREQVLEDVSIREKEHRTATAKLVEDLQNQRRELTSMRAVLTKRDGENADLKYRLAQFETAPSSRKSQPVRAGGQIPTSMGTPGSIIGDISGIGLLAGDDLDVSTVCVDERAAAEAESLRRANAELMQKLADLQNGNGNNAGHDSKLTSNSHADAHRRPASADDANSAVTNSIPRDTRPSSMPVPKAAIDNGSNDTPLNSARSYVVANTLGRHTARELRRDHKETWLELRAARMEEDLEAIGVVPSDRDHNSNDAAALAAARRQLLLLFRMAKSVGLCTLRVCVGAGIKAPWWIAAWALMYRATSVRLALAQVRLMPAGTGTPKQPAFQEIAAAMLPDIGTGADPSNLLSAEMPPRWYKEVVDASGEGGDNVGSDSVASAMSARDAVANGPTGSDLDLSGLKQWLHGDACAKSGPLPPPTVRASLAVGGVAWVLPSDTRVVNDTASSNTDRHAEFDSWRGLVPSWNTHAGASSHAQGSAPARHSHSKVLPADLTARRVAAERENAREEQLATLMNVAQGLAPTATNTLTETCAGDGGVPTGDIGSGLGSAESSEDAKAKDPAGEGNSNRGSTDDTHDKDEENKDAVWVMGIAAAAETAARSAESSAKRAASAVDLNDASRAAADAQAQSDEAAQCSCIIDGISTATTSSTAGINAITLTNAQCRAQKAATSAATAARSAAVAARVMKLIQTCEASRREAAAAARVVMDHLEACRRAARKKDLATAQQFQREASAAATIAERAGDEAHKAAEGVLQSSSENHKSNGSTKGSVIVDADVVDESIRAARVRCSDATRQAKEDQEAAKRWSEEAIAVVAAIVAAQEGTGNNDDASTSNGDGDDGKSVDAGSGGDLHSDRKSQHGADGGVGSDAASQKSQRSGDSYLV